MNKIFIEAENNRTPECNFLKTFVDLHFPTKDIEFICIGGISNLFNEPNINQMFQAQEVGDQVLILIDADTVAKGYGFIKRKAYIDSKMQTHKISFPYFIYPNNHDDGEVVDAPRHGEHLPWHRHRIYERRNVHPCDLPAPPANAGTLH